MIGIEEFLVSDTKSRLIRHGKRHFRKNCTHYIDSKDSQLPKTHKATTRCDTKSSGMQNGSVLSQNRATDVNTRVGKGQQTSAQIYTPGKDEIRSPQTLIRPLKTRHWVDSQQSPTLAFPPEKLNLGDLQATFTSCLDTSKRPGGMQPLLCPSLDFLESLEQFYTHLAWEEKDWKILHVGNLFLQSPESQVLLDQSNMETFRRLLHATEQFCASFISEIHHNFTETENEVRSDMRGKSRSQQKQVVEDLDPLLDAANRGLDGAKQMERAVAALLEQMEACRGHEESRLMMVVEDDQKQNAESIKKDCTTVFCCFLTALIFISIILNGLNGLLILAIFLVVFASVCLCGCKRINVSFCPRLERNLGISSALLKILAAFFFISMTFGIEAFASVVITLAICASMVFYAGICLSVCLPPILERGKGKEAEGFFSEKCNFAKLPI